MRTDLVRRLSGGWHGGIDLDATALAPAVCAGARTVLCRPGHHRRDRAKPVLATPGHRSQLLSGRRQRSARPAGRHPRRYSAGTSRLSGCAHDVSGGCLAQHRHRRNGRSRHHEARYVAHGSGQSVRGQGHHRTVGDSGLGRYRFRDSQMADFRHARQDHPDHTRDWRGHLLSARHRDLVSDAEHQPQRQGCGQIPPHRRYRRWTVHHLGRGHRHRAQPLHLGREDLGPFGV